MGKNKKKTENYNSSKKGGSKSGKKYRKPVLAIVMLILFSAVIVLDLVNVKYGSTVVRSERQMPEEGFAPGDGQRPQMNAEDSSSADSSASDQASSGAAASDSVTSAAASDADDTSAADTAGRQRPQMSAEDSSASDADGASAADTAGRQRPQMNAEDSSASDSDEASSTDTHTGPQMSAGSQVPGMNADGQMPQRPGEEDSQATGIFANEIVRKVMTMAKMYWIAILCVAVAADLLIIFYLISRHNRIKAEKAKEAARLALRAERGDDEDDDLDDDYDDDDDDDDRHVRRSPVRAAVLPLCLVLAVATVIYQLPTVQSAGDLMTVNAQVVSAQANSGTVTSTLTGSGSLSGESTVNLSIPSGVTVDTYYVSNGDTVESGDLLAAVNKTSVEEAIVSLQAAIDDLDADLEADDEADQEITATADGTVKAIFAQAGDTVTEVMEEYGALMLLSLDGSMEVDIDTKKGLSVGSKVIVVLSDGTQETGRVSQIEEGIARITIPDDNASYQEEVTVTDSDGNELGTGTLSIHSCLKVTGYYGEVYAVDAAVDEAVETGDQLLDITDANTAAESTILLDTREKLEERMAELYELRESPYIYAQLGGVVSGIPEEEDTEESENGSARSDSASDENSTASDIVSTTAETSSVVAEEADKTTSEDTTVQAAQETVPETAVPETTTPETAAPETQAATEAPATEKATEAPATEKATEAPATEKATEAPATEKATETPATEAAAQTQTSETQASDSTSAQTTVSAASTQQTRVSAAEESSTESGSTSDAPADGSYYGYITSIDSTEKKITINYAANKSQVSASAGTKYEITLDSLDNLSEGAIIYFTVKTEDDKTTVSDLTVLLADGTYAAKVVSISGSNVTVSYAVHNSDAADYDTISKEVAETSPTYTFSTDDVSSLKAGSILLLTVDGADINFNTVLLANGTYAAKVVSVSGSDVTVSYAAHNSDAADYDTLSSEVTDESSTYTFTSTTDVSSLKAGSILLLTVADSGISFEQISESESKNESESGSTSESEESSSGSDSSSSSGSGSSNSGKSSETSDSKTSGSRSSGSKTSDSKSSDSKSSSSSSKSSSESESSSSGKSKTGQGSTPSSSSAKSSTGSSTAGGSASGGSASGGSASGGNGSGSGASGTSAENASAQENTKASYDLYDLTDEDILTVAPQETMTITIEADELDILALQKGQSASITLDALEGRSFTGTVTSVNLTGTNEGGNTKYTATITLDKTDEMLEGMNASVRIETDSAQTSVTVPAEALVEKDGKTYVYTTYDEETDTLGGLQEVETGVSDGISVEVTEGLDEGQNYYYRYAETVDYTFS